MILSLSSNSVSRLDWKIMWLELEKKLEKAGKLIDVTRVYIKIPDTDIE